MTLFKNMSLLELAEDYALEVGHAYSDEESVSTEFDAMVMEHMIEMHGIPGTAFNDAAMISEAFSAWTDQLQTDGYLHAEQVRNYDYVGKWAEDEA